MSIALLPKTQIEESSEDDEIIVKSDLARKNTPIIVPATPSDLRAAAVLQQRKNSREKQIKDRLKQKSVISKTDKLSRQRLEQRPLKPQKKIIDWDKIHEKQFAKMTDIYDYAKQKEDRQRKMFSNPPSVGTTHSTSTASPHPSQTSSKTVANKFAMNITNTAAQPSKPKTPTMAVLSTKPRPFTKISSALSHAPSGGVAPKQVEAKRKFVPKAVSTVSTATGKRQKV